MTGDPSRRPNPLWKYAGLKPLITRDEMAMSKNFVFKHFTKIHWKHYNVER